MSPAVQNGADVIRVIVVAKLIRDAAELRKKEIESDSDEIEESEES